MFDLNDDNSNAFIVAAGLLIAHLFIYGRKIKKNIKIKGAELIGDAMQLGAMYVGAMSFFGGLDLIGIKPTDTWQTVMITILFAMSFETYFQRARDVFQERMGMVTAAILGKMPDDAMMKIPAGKGVPETIDVEIPVRQNPIPPTPKKAVDILSALPVKTEGDKDKDLTDKLDEIE